MIASAITLGGCATANVPDEETVDTNAGARNAGEETMQERPAETQTIETEEKKETNDEAASNAVVGPEIEGYYGYLFEGGYQGQTEEIDDYFPLLTGAKDASFLLRDIDGDKTLELYLCGTIEDGDAHFPAFCLLTYQDGEVQVLAEQYYQQRTHYSFLNNNYLCRYEEGLSESPLFFPAEDLKGYDPNQDEWMGDYYDLYLWSPDPDKEDVHLVQEGGGFYHGDQYLACPYTYLYNDEKITKEEYDALQSQYTENAQIPEDALQPLSKDNLLKAVSETPAEVPQQENKPDLTTLLESIEGDYTDNTDPDYPRSFYIGRDGMNWFGGYPVTAEDVVDFGSDYVLFQDSGGSYYKVRITDDALFISYGNTPAAIKSGAVIERNTKQTL